MSQLTNNFLKLRNQSSKIILEGFHPIKHAIRFGATIDILYTHNKPAVMELAIQKAPDIVSFLEKNLLEISSEEYNKLSPKPPKTGIVGAAVKPQYNLAKVLENPGNIVFLENVRSLDNLGAVIRVCSARGLSAVLSSGTIDPFHSSCVRAARGLHFAIPVININQLPQLNRKIIIFDENGQDFTNYQYPENSILVFGSERLGVSKELKQKADKILSIPMKPNVSSLNLATSVAIAVYK